MSMLWRNFSFVFHGVDQYVQKFLPSNTVFNTVMGEPVWSFMYDSFFDLWRRMKMEIEDLNIYDRIQYKWCRLIFMIKIEHNLISIDFHDQDWT